jgi:hypothetical protein
MRRSEPCTWASSSGSLSVIGRRSPDRQARQPHEAVGCEHSWTATHFNRVLGEASRPVPQGRGGALTFAHGPRGVVLPSPAPKEPQLDAAWPGFNLALKPPG